MLRLAFDFVLVGVSLRSGNPGNEASLRAEAGGIGAPFKVRCL